MELAHAAKIVVAAVHDNLTETGELAQIETQCREDAEFKEKLAEACGMNQTVLDRTIREALDDINLHHALMERRERRYR